MPRVKFNYRELNRVVNKTAEVNLKPIASLLVKENVGRSLEILEEEILKDPLSKELIAGTTLSKSKFIMGYFKKYGNNLFSFFGFQAGTTPVQDLISLLKKSYAIKIDKGKYTYGKNGKSKYTFNIRYPSFEDIRANTKLPWGSKSWIDAAEKGLTNIINYIRKKDYGRSEYGIQIKGKIDKEFRPKPDYFFDKYKRFIARLSKGKLMSWKEYNE
jgi:hypothetical protein